MAAALFVIMLVAGGVSLAAAAARPEVSLPDHDAASIGTGQYVEAAGGYRNIRERGIPAQVAERVDKAALGEYPAKLGERFPEIRSDFDVHLIENRLIYVKEQCTRDDVAAQFFLHVYPAAPGDLPDHRKPHGFDNFDFQFDQYDTRSDGTCLAEISLPDYDIAAIETGQYVKAAGGYRTIWEAGIPVQMAELVDKTALGEYLAKLGEQRLVIHSGIDVRLVENRLIYVKEQCGLEDVAARFFLHVYPASPDDLPDHRKPHGFDNFDFQFDQYGPRLGGTCLAEVSLPGYDAAAIRTGQYVKAAGGYRNIWEGDIPAQMAERAARTRAGEHLADHGERQPGAHFRSDTSLHVRVGKVTLDEYLAKLGERRLVIHSDFKVHLVENRLIYVKEQCARDDVAARFFLHVYPVSPDDLPDHRKLHGLDNFSFRFDQYGTRLGGTCLAEVSLPGYDAAAIRTGQYVKAAGGYRNIWEGGIRLE